MHVIYANNVAYCMSAGAFSAHGIQSLASSAAAAAAAVSVLFIHQRRPPPTLGCKYAPVVVYEPIAGPTRPTARPASKATAPSSHCECENMSIASVRSALGPTDLHNVSMHCTKLQIVKFPLLVYTVLGSSTALKI